MNRSNVWTLHLCVHNAHTLCELRADGRVTRFISIGPGDTVANVHICTVRPSADDRLAVPIGTRLLAKPVANDYYYYRNERHAWRCAFKFHIREQFAVCAVLTYIHSAVMR